LHQLIRPVYLDPNGSQDDQAVAHLRDACLSLSLLRQRPAPEDLIERYSCRKALLARNGHGGLGLRLGGLSVAGAPMEPGCPFQSGGAGKQMWQLLRQPQCLLLLVQGLLRIASDTEGPCRITPAAPSRVVSAIAQARTVLLRSVVCDTLCEQHLGLG